jgi:hypothetical protein
MKGHLIKIIDNWYYDNLGLVINKLKRKDQKQC